MVFFFSLSFTFFHSSTQLRTPKILHTHPLTRSPTTAAPPFILGRAGKQALKHSLEVLRVWMRHVLACMAVCRC